MGGHSEEEEIELLSEDENSYLELLLFAKKSTKNIPVSEKLNWFDYGSFYHDYSRGCDGLAVHSVARFFEPNTGRVWAPRKELSIKICHDPKEEFVGKGVHGLVIQTNKSKCSYLENPLCSNLIFHIDPKKMKISRQSPWEFTDSLGSRGVKVDVSSEEKAKEIYGEYFAE